MQTIAHKAGDVREALRDNCRYVYLHWADGLRARIVGARQRAGVLQVKLLTQGTWINVTGSHTLCRG